MQGITALSLNLPEEIFDLLKDSVVTGRVSNYFELKSIKEGYMQGKTWITTKEHPYLVLSSSPVQVGVVKDLGLNSFVNLISDQFEYRGVHGGKFLFVKPHREFTDAELALHNASISGSITYSPEQYVEIEDTPEGETLTHHYGEEQYLRKAVKDKSTGQWSWQILMTKEQAMALPVVPRHIRVFTPKQLQRWAGNTLTEDQFNRLVFEERKLTDIDVNVDVANLFVEVAEVEEDKIGLEVYFNGKTNNEKPFASYTAVPTGWWNKSFRIEWKFYNEQPLPDVLSDGVHDMRDTAAALSEVGNFGMVSKVYFNMNDVEGYTMKVREANLAEGEIPHYDAANKTFVYDPNKKAFVGGTIRIMPIVGGKEATYECFIDLNTKEVMRQL